MQRWTRPLLAEPDRVILSHVWTTSTCYKPREIERALFASSGAPLREPPQRRAGAPPERPGARRRTALRGCGWCWTGAAGWGRVVPQGCPGATASARATGKAGGPSARWWRASGTRDLGRPRRPLRAVARRAATEPHISLEEAMNPLMNATHAT